MFANQGREARLQEKVGESLANAIIVLRYGTDYSLPVFVTGFSSVGKLIAIGLLLRFTIRVFWIGLQIKA